jgi:uncharacterized protein (DUF433 family)
MKKYLEYIDSNHEIMLGKPVLKGTRITVELILRKLSQGASLKDLKKMYPFFEDNHYHSVLEYAADILANDDVLELA